jgi:hypothetical protein
MSPPRRHTDVAKSAAWMLLTPVPLPFLLPGRGRVALGCNRLCELRRLLPGACLRQKAGRQGPRTPAQISQYAASPIRYGQPPQTAARLHG